MIFLIKDINYFQDLINVSSNSFHINNNNKGNISIKNIEDIINNNLYKNIFFHIPLYLDFFKNINDNQFPNLNIYIFINNLNYIHVSLLLKIKIIMEKEDYYSMYLGEIEKYLNNKNYIINIPNEYQVGALRYFLIKIITC